MVGEPFQPGRQRPYIVLPFEPAPLRQVAGEIARSASQTASAARNSRLAHSSHWLLRLWAANEGNGGIVLHGRIGSPFAPLQPIELPVVERLSCGLSVRDARLWHECSGLMVYDLHVSVRSAPEVAAGPGPAPTPESHPSRRQTAAQNDALDDKALDAIMKKAASMESHKDIDWRDSTAGRRYKLNKQFADQMPDLPGERPPGWKRKAQRLTDALNRWRSQQG
jgi:hypothetical protein